MPSIQLNFINQSNDQNNTQVAIYQKTQAGAGIAIAWTVINSTPGQKVYFSYPVDSTVSASDSFGNKMPIMAAADGNRFDMISTPMGNQLQRNTKINAAPGSIEIWNELPVNAIDAMFYKDNKLLALKTSVGPGQNASCVCEPTLYLNLTQNVEQGDVMDSSVIAVPDFQFSMLGLVSLDLVMRGGGAGTNAEPVLFYIENAKMS